MAKPYSQDLRDRVIEAVERGKMSRRAAGRHYAISEFVAIKWLERLERLQNLQSDGLYDERMIDDRNARPLTIAFATIVMVWMLAFGIVSVSAQVGARPHHMADSAAAIEK